MVPTIVSLVLTSGVSYATAEIFKSQKLEGVMQVEAMYSSPEGDAFIRVNPLTTFFVPKAQIGLMTLKTTKGMNEAVRRQHFVAWISMILAAYENPGEDDDDADGIGPEDLDEVPLEELHAAIQRRRQSP